MLSLNINMQQSQLGLQMANDDCSPTVVYAAHHKMAHSTTVRNQFKYFQGP